MRTEKNEKIEKVLQGLASESVPENIRKLAEETSQNFNNSLAGTKQHIQWSKIMKTRITKLVAAVIIIATVILSVTMLDKSAAPAYAIEQTIEANRGLRYIHVQNVSPPAYGPQDTWLEFDQHGELAQMRVEEGRDDDFRVTTWVNDTIKWWSPPKNKFIVMHNKLSRQEIQSTRERADPRYAVQSLQDLVLEGRMDIEVEQPTEEEGLIKLTATDTTPIEELPARTYLVRYVLLIDPETKLARQRDTYILKDGQYELKKRQLYLEYNKPIDPEMFVLEAPDGVELEDRTQGIGIAQGNMTDSEAAAEVVRQYIKALVDKDYEKAGKLYNGTPGEKLRQWAKAKYVRLIGIGEPVPQPDFGPRAFGVPFAFVTESANGKQRISGPYGGLDWSQETEDNLDLNQHRQAMVRPVVDQPDRWVIVGGI